MSMNYSEFRRLLGADPQSQDPEFLAAKQSGAQFRQATEDAAAFERQLGRAMEVDVPAGLLDEIKAISTLSLGRRPSWWRPVAIAAGVLLTVGAVGLAWNMNRGWDSVEDYVMDHYEHDGAVVLAQAEAGTAFGLQQILAGFGVEMSDEMSQAVGFVKLCPTPEGKGIHLVLNTDQGPVTVIYMPETRVGSGGDIHFNGMHAHLLSMASGSVAIIGSDELQLEHIYSEVYQALTPVSASA